MPPLPDVPNVVKVRHVGTIATHHWQTVQHFSFLGGPATGADMAAIAEAAHLSLAAHWQRTPVVSRASILEFTVAMDLTTRSGAVRQYTDLVPGGGEYLPIASTAALVSWKTRRRSRGGHARTYLPGVCAIKTGDGRTWGDDVIEVMGRWADAYAANVAAASYPVIRQVSHCVVSYYDKAQVPTPPHRRETPLVEHIVGHEESAIIRSQRRRVRTTPEPYGPTPEFRKPPLAI